MAHQNHVDAVRRVIRELTVLKKVARRDEIVRLTGLKKSVVDECIKDLVEDYETVVKLRSGVCMIKPTFEEDPLTATLLDDGRTKWECGNQIWTLTPLQTIAQAKLSAGFASLAGV